MKTNDAKRKTRNTKCSKCNTPCLTDRDFMTHACLEYQNPTPTSEATVKWDFDEQKKNAEECLKDVIANEKPMRNVKPEVEHTPTPWRADATHITAQDERPIAITNVNGRSNDRGQAVDLDLKNAAFIVRAVNSFDELTVENTRLRHAHEELLAIVKAIAESFNAGANQVYAEALAPHTDDETLKTWINKAIAKATGGK